MSLDCYYVNKNGQNNGDHEVHKENCPHCANSENRIYLGFYTDCKDAVKEAKKYYNQVDGCYYCTNKCHHS